MTSRTKNLGEVFRNPLQFLVIIDRNSFVFRSIQCFADATATSLQATQQHRHYKQRAGFTTDTVTGTATDNATDTATGLQLTLQQTLQQFFITYLSWIVTTQRQRHEQQRASFSQPNFFFSPQQCAFSVEVCGMHSTTSSR